jgi:hypothetical protein
VAEIKCVEVDELLHAIEQNYRRVIKKYDE